MVSQSKKTKIAIVAYNLEVGGLATVIINIYKLLKTVTTIKIELLLLDANKNQNIAHKAICFGEIATKKSSIPRKIKKHKIFKKHLEEFKYDFILDFRYRINPLTEILITKFLYPKTKIIYNVHSSKTDGYFPKNKKLAQFLYGDAFKIVCCSKGVEKLLIKKYNFKNAVTLYNPLDIKAIDIKKEEATFINFEYILAIGRIEPLKQIDKLIKAYKNSNLLQKNIKLLIVGEGSHLSFCKNLVKTYNLEESIIFKPFSSNPYKYMKQAKFLVLCSEYEGFPMVILEVLTCNTPVISFDLLTGPNEIITNKKNGLLVENQNFEALTKAINILENNKALYNACKDNTRQSVLKFSMDNIKQEWLHLLEIE